MTSHVTAILPSKQGPLISHILLVNSRVQLAQFTWIHRISVNKYGVSISISRDIMSFTRDDMYQWNCTSSDPVRLVSNSVKTCDNRQKTCIHMNTHENTYMYWWSSTNYEPVWHLPTGSNMVPCLPMLPASKHTNYMWRLPYPMLPPSSTTYLNLLINATHNKTQTQRQADICLGLPACLCVLLCVTLTGSCR